MLQKYRRDEPIKENQSSSSSMSETQCTKHMTFQKHPVGLRADSRDAEMERNMSEYLWLHNEFLEIYTINSDPEYKREKPEWAISPCETPNKT